MKLILISTILLFGGLGTARSEMLDEAIERFLAGEKIEAAMSEKIADAAFQSGSSGDDQSNGSRYLKQIKVSIIDPARNCGWPWRSPCVNDARIQKVTYLELKVIYEKNKTPVVAYALVCPAMFVDDMEMVPELIAKIAENQPLKARFDEMYAKFWKPHLDPDF